MVWNPELTYSSDQEEAYQTINRSFLDDELKIIYIFFLKMPQNSQFFPKNDNKYMQFKKVIIKWDETPKKRNPERIKEASGTQGELVGEHSGSYRLALGLSYSPRDVHEYLCASCLSLLIPQDQGKF